MTRRRPPYKADERAIVARLAALAEQTPAAPAGLNRRLLLAVSADQGHRQGTADQGHRQGTADQGHQYGAFALGALCAALAMVVVTITTSSTWLSALHLYWHVTLGA